MGYREYSKKREAAVAVAEALMRTGAFTLVDFIPDRSDSMTEYYSPATWGGYATGMGVVIVSGQRWQLDPNNKTEPKMLAPKGATYAVFTPAGKLIGQGRLGAAIERLGCSSSTSGQIPKIADAEVEKILTMIRKATPGLSPTPAPMDAEAVSEITVRRNLPRQGIEVLFPGKPDDAALEWLKANGFHWSMRQKLWYRKYDEATFAAVSELFKGPVPVVNDETPAPPDVGTLGLPKFRGTAAAIVNGAIDLGKAPVPVMSMTATPGDFDAVVMARRSMMHVV